MFWVIKCLLYKHDLNSDPSTTIQANKPVLAVGGVCVCVVVYVWWDVVDVVCGGGVCVLVCVWWWCVCNLSTGGVRGRDR